MLCAIQYQHLVSSTITIAIRYHPVYILIYCILFQVYRVERNDAGKYEKVAIPEKSIGFFYGGDSYLVHYEYNGGKNHLIYFWQVCF